jgi:signal peptidase I
MRQIKFSSFFAGFVLVAVLLTWIIFLPMQFGGATAYVIIDGNSMEPVYHQGDLVIVRRQAGYRVGEIVTYHNLDLDRNVIHRIVGLQDGRFVLQGDNNSWLDDDQPTPDRVIGKAWIHIPGLGKWLSKLQTPLGVTILAVIAGLIILSLFISRDRRIRARRDKYLSGSRLVSFSFDFPQGDAVMRNIGRQLETLVFVLVILLGLSLFLAFSSFTRPENLDSSSAIEYFQVGKFTYQASAREGIYDPGGPQTGDPVFLKAACQVTLNFNYSLIGTTISDVSGEISLRAETRDLNGWVRSFPLAAPVAFSDSNTLIQASFNPCEMMASLREIEASTQLSRPFYTLVIIPEVSFTGQSLGRPIEGTFSPELKFYLDDYQMYVLSSEFPGIDPYAPYLVGKMNFSNQQPNLVQLPFFSITVRLARILAIIGLVLSLGLGAFVTVLILREIQTDPSIGISLRYGTLIVDVNEISFDIRSRLIKVDAFEDIVKLAERNSTAIMHLRRKDEHEFLVEGNSVVYSYRVPHRR